MKKPLPLCYINKKLTKVTLKNNEKLKTVYLAEGASVATDISKKLIKRK